MSQFRWLSLIFLLILSGTTFVSGQAAGADDASNSDSGDQNVVGPEASDPNLVAPTNKQGYGKDIQTNLKKKDTVPMKITHQETDIGEQSIQAMLQFGVLVINQ